MTRELTFEEFYLAQKFLGRACGRARHANWRCCTGCCCKWERGRERIKRKLNTHVDTWTWGYLNPAILMGVCVCTREREMYARIRVRVRENTCNPLHSCVWERESVCVIYTQYSCVWVCKRERERCIQRYVCVRIYATRCTRVCVRESVCVIYTYTLRYVKPTTLMWVSECESVCMCVWKRDAYVHPCTDGDMIPAIRVWEREGQDV